MKKPLSTYTIKVEGGSTIIGIPPGHTLSIALAGGKVYSAPITWVHQTMARKFSRENPTGSILADDACSPAAKG
jgi:hypothetical protein